MCVRICVCVCMYACVYIYVCTYMYVHICVCVCMYVCVYVYMYVYVCVLVGMCIYVCIYICVCTNICMCVGMYLDMYICTYVCRHVSRVVAPFPIFLLTHTLTHTCSPDHLVTINLAEGSIRPGRKGDAVGHRQLFVATLLGEGTNEARRRYLQQLGYVGVHGVHERMHIPDLLFCFVLILFFSAPLYLSHCSHCLVVFLSKRLHFNRKYASVSSPFPFSPHLFLLAFPIHQRAP